MKLETDPALAEAIRKAAAHKMTPTERRAQRISFIAGMTGQKHEAIKAWLDKHEGR